MTETTCDLLLHNATVATMDGPDYGLLQEGSVGITAGIITHLGARGDLSGIVERDLDARLLTPALVDCHTHLVYAGDRVTEFERRLGGASYEDLALSGGGIMSTVRTTRAAQDDDLFDLGMQRLSWLLQSGVGTVEIKSGYGLTVESELRMLRVARQLGEASSIRVTTSLLAAHAVPPGWDADTYVDDICQEVIRAAADEGLADSVDAFCETIAFSPAQVRRVFEAARAIGLPVRLHADQLSRSRFIASLRSTHGEWRFPGLQWDLVRFLPERQRHRHDQRQSDHGDRSTGRWYDRLDLPARGW